MAKIMLALIINNVELIVFIKLVTLLLFYVSDRLYPFLIHKLFIIYTSIIK